MSNLAYNPAYTPPPIVAMQCGAEIVPFEWSGRMKEFGIVDEDLADEIRKHVDVDLNRIGFGLRDAMVDGFRVDRRLIENKKGGTLASRIKPASYVQLLEEEKGAPKNEHAFSSKF